MCHFLCFTKAALIKEQAFLREPFDQIATVGEHVTLPCRVVNKRGVLQWTRDDFGLGTDRNLTGYHRYHMTGSDEEGKPKSFLEFSLKNVQNGSKLGRKWDDFGLGTNRNLTGYHMTESDEEAKTFFFLDFFLWLPWVEVRPFTFVSEINHLWCYDSQKDTEKDNFGWFGGFASESLAYFCANLWILLVQTSSFVDWA